MHARVLEGKASGPCARPLNSSVSAQMVLVVVYRALAGSLLMQIIYTGHNCTVYTEAE
jgi:hypothetical protein